MSAAARTYEGVQAEIDARESELESQGVNLSELYDGRARALCALLGIEPAGVQMPADLDALYFERDRVWQEELRREGKALPFYYMMQLQPTTQHFL